MGMATKESKIMGVKGIIKKSNGLPCWLTSLVHGRFYEQCEIHSKLPRKYFCIDCRQDAICMACNDHHKKLYNHNILEAYKASNEATIKISELKNLWSDVSVIAPFKINNHKIVFISTKGREGHLGNSNGFGRCKTCQYALKDQSNFCSIECYVKSGGRMPQQFNKENAIQLEKFEEPPQPSSFVEDENGEDQSKKSCPPPLPNNSFRKRSRKGIPIRAPTGDFRDNLRFRDCEF